MKKKLLLCLLCMTLLFVIGCGSETGAGLPTPEPSQTATPTPTPANAAKEALDSFEDKVNTLLTWNGTADVDLSKGVGYDVSMDISINQLLLSLLGLQDLRTIHIDMSADMKENVLAADMTFHLNEDELLNFDMFFDSQKLLYNFPKYSSQYCILQAASDTAGSVEVPDTQEILSLYQNFISDFFAAFRPTDGYVDNATISRDGYQVIGQKFTLTADLTELNDALNRFASAFQEMYPDGETSVTEFPIDNYNRLVIDFYKGDNGTFAWECYPDTATDEPLGLISTAKGFCLYITTEGATETLLRSEKTTSADGTLYFQNEETEQILNYTLTENSLTVSDEEGNFTLSFDWNFSDTLVSMNLSLATTDFGITYNVVSEKTKSHVELSLSSYDTPLIKLTGDATFRDFEPVTMPENYVDEETWNAQLNTDAFDADLEELLAKYPALENLFGTEEESEPITPTPSVPEGTYDDSFQNLTGYAVDAYGNVEFLAQESEVLALGLSSTGIYGVPLSEDERLALLNYGSTVLDNAYSEYGTFYKISGNIYSSVDSYFYTEYYTADANNYYNQVDLYLEALTGDFYSVGVANVSKEKAFAMANDILAILGEPGRLDINTDTASLEAGVWVGDYYIYGWDNVDYFLIRIY